MMVTRQCVSRLGRRALLNSLKPRIYARTFATEVTTMQPSLDGSAPKPFGSTKAEWKEIQRQSKIRAHMGAVPDNMYKPHELVNDPPSPRDITLELLMASQAHMGHSTSLWNPMNSRYIFGVRQGIHIISLETTAAHLKRACRVVEAVAERGGLILFVGTRRGQERCVIKAAALAKGCHLFERWIPGSLTNGQQILGCCQMVVVDELDREMKDYEGLLVDRSVLKPDLVVCLNPLENEVLLHECGLHHIPTIGVIDTDANPTWVTYPIPANDDSLRCIQVIAGVLGRAGQQGQQKRLELAKTGKVLYQRVVVGEGFEAGVESKRSDNATESKKSESAGEPKKLEKPGGSRNFENDSELEEFTKAAGFTMSNKHSPNQGEALARKLGLARPPPQNRLAATDEGDEEDEEGEEDEDDLDEDEEDEDEDDEDDEESEDGEESPGDGSIRHGGAMFQ